jgi:Protein of unknown function (DUF2934)
MERMSELTKPKPRSRRQTKSTGRDNVAVFSDQALRDAAYYLWEHEGRPEGRALDHWLRASQRLQSGRSAA